MQIEVVTLGFLALVVLLSFGYLLRVEQDRALRLWSWAWGMLIGVAGLDMLLQRSAVLIGHPLQIFTTFAIATAIPFVLLLAALAWAGRRAPRWLVAGGLLACGLRAGLGAAGHVQASTLLSIPIEVGADLAGALVIWRARQRESRPLIAALLAGMYSVMAGMEAGMAIVYISGIGIPTARLVAGVIALGMAGVQIVAVMNRVRDRGREALRLRERDLGLLRKVARLAIRHETSEGLLADAVDLLVADLDLAGAGVWRVDRERGALVDAASRGLPEPFLREFRSVPIDQPSLQPVLCMRDPIISDGADPARPAIHPALAAGGIETAAFLQLYWQEEMLGVLVLTARSGRSFGDSAVALFSVLADELALAFHHVQTVESRMHDTTLLANERHTLLAVLETAPIGILVEGPGNRIELVNRRGVEHIACGAPEDWIGRSMHELIENFLPRIHDPEQKRDRVRQAAQQRHVVEDLEVTLHDPEERTLLLFQTPIDSGDGERLGRVWLSRDVTEERRLEEQLRHSQKLETIGTLSGGIAHDFNNQLAVILGNTRYVKRQLAATSVETSDVSESLVDLERAADHCAQLTRSLLAFARRTPVTIQVLDTERVIDDLMELLRPLIPSSIEIVLENEPGLPPMAADPTQIQQVLLNLAINARDAMKERGRLRIAASACLVDADRARGVLGARPGAFVEIEVSDTGCGLDPESLTRIFEPFYTTKPVGEGTGLGLAIVHGVVTAHQGWIELESQPGRGTTFRVLLPQAEAEERGALGASALAVETGGETILVVDDEAGIRRLVRLELEQRGYLVLEAADGGEGLLRLRERPGEIDLVLLDLTMPGMDGLEARRRIHQQSPQTLVLLSSGRPPITSPGDEIAPDCFVQKPYSMSQLALRVRSLIEGRARGAI